MNRRSPSADSRLPDLAALLVVTIWGVNFVFLKAALAEFDPLAFTWLRFAGMLVVGWALMLWQRRQGLRAGAERVARADLPRLALGGVLGFSLYISLSIVGLKYTTAFSNALLIAVSPLFTILLLRASGLETIRRAHWLAMLISLAGLSLFLADKLEAGFVLGGLGDLISLCAAFFWAAYNVVNKPLLGRYSSSTVTTYGLTIGALPLMLVALPALFAQNWSVITAGGWITLVWSAIFPVYFAWMVWSWVNARAGVARTSLFMYLVPFVGGVASWFLLGEQFGLLKIAGACIVVAGLVTARFAGAQTAPVARSARPAPATTFVDDEPQRA